MANTHYTRAKGMQKVRLENLWRNCHPVRQSKRSRVDKAVFGTNSFRSSTPQDTNKVRLLEIEKAKLKLQLKNITREYKKSRSEKINISCVMADLIVKIENIEKMIARAKHL